MVCSWGDWLPSHYVEGIMPKQIKLGLRPKLDVEAMAVTVRVMDGKVEKQATTFNWADVDGEIQKQLSLAGLSTVLQQRCSGIKEDPVAKLDAMDEVFALWMDGEWAKEREGGARLVAPIIEVLAGLKKASIADVQKSWAKLDKDVQAAIAKKHATRVKEIEEQRARETEVVDLTDMA